MENSPLDTWNQPRSSAELQKFIRERLARNIGAQALKH